MNELPKQSIQSATEFLDRRGRLNDKTYIRALERGVENRFLNYENIHLHILTVAKVSRVLADMLDLGQEDAEKLETAALYHDASKRFEITGRRVGIFVTRSIAEESGSRWLQKCDVSEDVIEISRSTHPQTAVQYAQGTYRLDEHLLGNLLFFSDEIVHKNTIVDWEFRIDSWTDESLKAPRAEYNGLSQQQVEKKWAQEVEDYILQVTGIQTHEELMAQIKNNVDSLK